MIQPSGGRKEERMMLPSGGNVNDAIVFRRHEATSMGSMDDVSVG